MLKHNNCVIKNMLPERFCLLGKMSLIKKSFICKGKAGTVTKVKLVTKIRKHIQFYFQNTGSKESSNMALKKISE